MNNEDFEMLGAIVFIATILCGWFLLLGHLIVTVLAIFLDFEKVSILNKLIIGFVISLLFSGGPIKYASQN